MNSQEGAVLQLGVWEWGQLLTVNKSLIEHVTKGLGLGRILWIKRRKLRKMGMRFGSWNVRSLYRAGSLMMIVKRL
jgi:hypothetical protein